MVTARMSGTSAAPVVASRGGTAAVRGLGAFLVVLVGLLALTVLFGDSGWAWLLMLGVGLVAGAVGGRAWMAFVALAGLVAFHAATIAFDLPRDTKFYWYIGAAFNALLLAIAFVVGVDVGWRRSPVAAAREGWAAFGRRGRMLAIGAVVVALVGSLVYAGVVVAIGPPIFVTPGDKAADCRTPYYRYGWAYEAINYDKSFDATLAPGWTWTDGQEKAICGGTWAPAGAEIVSSDGVRLAGWYIPAVAAADSNAPTLLLVHGWKDNKSGMLPFAAALHQDYNLVLFDLRNGGQSGGDKTSMGLYERRDVVAMLDWLDAAKHPSWVGVVANSMGAATALAVAAEDQRIRALILDSMHADVVTSYSNAMQEDFEFPGGPAAWVLANAVSWKVGGDITVMDPIRSIVRLGDRPVLLTAGLQDQVDTPAEATDRNFKAALAAGVNVELQYCHEGKHGQVIFSCAEEWGSWATSFLSRAVKG